MTSNIGLPLHAIEKMNSVFSAHPEVEKVVLYGSRAKGNFKNGSDIDLTLFGSALTHQHLLTLMGELDDLLLPWMIDLSIYATLDHPALREHIARVGVVFYERDSRGGEA